MSSFKKPTSKDVKVTAVTLIAATGGAMLSRVASDQLAKPAIDGAPTEAEANKKLVVKGVLAAAGALCLMAVKGDDTQSNALKGAFLGAALLNTLDVIQGFAKKSAAVTANTSTGKLMRSAFGLGCACSENKGLNRVESGNVCIRQNPDGTRTIYTSQGGSSPCPYGGNTGTVTPTATLNRPSLRMPEEYFGGTGLDAIASKGAMLMN